MSDYETKVNADGIPVKSERVQRAEEWTDSVIKAWDDEEASIFDMGTMVPNQPDEEFPWVGEEYSQNVIGELLMKQGRDPGELNMKHGDEGWYYDEPEGGNAEQMYPEYPPNYDFPEEQAVEEGGYKVFGDDTIWDPGFVEDVNYWMNEWAMPILGFGGGVRTGVKAGKNILGKSRTKGYKEGFTKGMQSEYGRAASKKAMDNLKSTLKGFEPNTIAWKKGLEEWLTKNPQYRKAVEQSMKWSRELFKKNAPQSISGKFDISDILKQRIKQSTTTTGTRVGSPDPITRGFDKPRTWSRKTLPDAKPLTLNEKALERLREAHRKGLVNEVGEPILPKKGFRKIGIRVKPKTSKVMDNNWTNKISEILERNAIIARDPIRSGLRPASQARLGWQGGRGGSGGFGDINREIHRKFSHPGISNDLIGDIRRITWEVPEHQVLDGMAQLKKTYGIDNELLSRVFERIQKVRGQEAANKNLLPRKQ